MRHGLRPRALCLLIIAVALAHALLLLIPEKPTAKPAASTLDLVLAPAIPAPAIRPQAPPTHSDRRRPAPPAPANESAPMQAPVTSKSIQTAPAHDGDAVAMTRSIETHAPQTESRSVTSAGAASTAPLQVADFRAASLGNRPADYPRLARQRGWEGKVVLEVDVSAQGQARTVRVVRSSGYAQLDEAAVEAVTQWRFTPARRGNEPQADTVHVPVEFRLK